MAVDERRLREARKQSFGIGLLKGMAVTLKHLFKHNTVIEYPDEKQELAPRTRGVIALKEENCTVCMLCGRECPDWCIYIDSHKETLPPKREGGRPRKRNVLDRFAIDYALCMYCGICVEVCPYDALFWSREFEYAEYDIRQMTHEKERLSDWMSSVLPPPELETGADLPGAPAREAGATGPGSAQRPSTPSQATAAEARPEQAVRAPEPAAASAPPPAQATASQVQAGETQPAGTTALPERTEQEPAETPDSAKKAPAAGEEREDPEAAYRRVLTEQQALGSSGQVAEARAKVARVKAERSVPRAPTPVVTDKPVPSAPVKGEQTPPVPSGAPAAEEPAPAQGPVAPTEIEAEAADAGPVAPETEVEAAGAELAAEDVAVGQTASQEPVAQAQSEDPEAAYERVLAEERAKGSSDAVAVGRAKAARMRARKGTSGPAG